MSPVNEKWKKRSFCVELNSRDQIKRVSLPDGSGDRLMIEGFLGELEELSLVEGIMLEMRGQYGVLKIDLSEAELRKMLRGDEKDYDKDRDD